MLGRRRGGGKRICSLAAAGKRCFPALAYWGTPVLAAADLAPVSIQLSGAGRSSHRCGAHNASIGLDQHAPNPVKPGAVLAAVKDAARRAKGAVAYGHP
jgi:hypothetical protein